MDTCRIDKCDRHPVSGENVCSSHYFRLSTESAEYFKKIEEKTWVYIPKTQCFVLRLDGKGFSKVVKRFDVKWPFDPRLSDIMVRVTTDLAKYYSVDYAYTMSDEITLVFKSTRCKDIRTFKYISEVAGLCSSLFYKYFIDEFDVAKDLIPPYFDCRYIPILVSDIPKMLKWRQWEEVKNSCANVAFSHFRGKQEILSNMSSPQMNKKLITLKGLEKSWDFYPDIYKYGALIHKEEKVVSKEPLVKTIKGVKKIFERKATRNVWVSSSILFKDKPDEYILKILNK